MSASTGGGYGSGVSFRSLVPKAAVGMIRECAARRQYSICPD
jgi:hypothetical protein